MKCFQGILQRNKISVTYRCFSRIKYHEIYDLIYTQSESQPQSYTFL